MKDKDWIDQQINRLDGLWEQRRLSAGEYEKRKAKIFYLNKLHRERENRSRALRDLKSLLESGGITSDQYSIRKQSIEKKVGKKDKKKVKPIEPVSADTLRSGMGTLQTGAVFKRPHTSFRSPRIRGETARLAKNSDAKMVSTIGAKEKRRKRPATKKKENSSATAFPPR